MDDHIGLALFPAERAPHRWVGRRRGIEAESREEEGEGGGDGVRIRAKGTNRGGPADRLGRRLGLPSNISPSYAMARFSPGVF